MKIVKPKRTDISFFRSPDGDEFTLAEVDDLNGGIELTRCNKRLMELLDRRARQNTVVPLPEAKVRPALG